MKRGAFAVVLVVSAAPCGAQLLELQPGARVRVTAPGILGGRLDGTIGARRGDTLSVVQQGIAPINIPISSLTSVETFRGKSHLAGAKRGALWGAAIGLPLGAAAALGDNREFNVVDDTCDPDFFECDMYTDTEFVVLMTVGSTLIGAGIGAIIGRAHWEKLQLPVRSSILAPSKGRVGIGLALRF